jgi:hypothetical protein
VLLVFVLRSFFINDAAALAIAGAIPVIRVIVLLVLRRKLDWIGLVGVFGFAAVFVVSILSGGSSLPLKLYHPVITGIIGLLLLGSALVRRPLILILIRLFNKSSYEQIKNPESLRKYTVITLLIGFVFIVDALVHIYMAFTLSTLSYMSLSRIVTIAGVLVLAAGVRLIRRNKIN